MTADSSQSDLSITPTFSPAAAKRAKQSRLEVWLDGEVVACGCPDCGSPMSIRMWLKLADCFRCATSIELTEEIIEEIERLEKQARPAAADENGAPRAAAAGRGPAAVPPPPPETKPEQPPEAPNISAIAALEDDEGRIAAAELPIGVRRKIHDMATEGAVRVWWHEMFHDLTAWLTSAVLHVAALLILAMIILAAQQEDTTPYITLSTAVDPNKQEGGETVTLPSDEVDFDLPIDPNDLPETREAQLKLAQEARELRIDPAAPVPNAPPVEAVRSAIASSDPDRRALAVRDPRVRAELVRAEGGTTMTEAAVSRGLRWMAMHQNSDGSWSLDRFNRAGDCKGRCNGHGGMRTDPGATSLALLPYLGAGQTHLVGKYQSQVGSALKYLMSIQKENGDLRGNSGGNSGMYAHGQATLVLCEAFKMTGDELLREPAQKGIDFIVNAQHQGGGWRYRPAYEDHNQVPDTSVLGWQVLSLHSAKAAYLDVPESALQLAGFYLDSAQSGQHGGLYCYDPRRSKAAKPSMTAEGLLCRMMLGWKLDNPGMQEGIGFLLKNHLPSSKTKNVYYWYYATQMMHHVGGRPWETWNLKIRDLLVRLQDKHGHQAGSWPPSVDDHGGQGGRLYTTAFATAILEVYYRHAPLFRQIELE